jgi:hypothetical protein
LFIASGESYCACGLHPFIGNDPGTTLETRTSMVPVREIIVVRIFLKYIFTAYLYIYIESCRALGIGNQWVTHA